MHSPTRTGCRSCRRLRRPCAFLVAGTTRKAHGREAPLTRRFVGPVGNGVTFFEHGGSHSECREQPNTGLWRSW
ncbi:hypothetical protein C5613_03265 [Rhodococcus opacus]|uniref:Uncharacterized protein n=1 Tax=Rhodococcus opacus TaxID=37919 RepID=A0A2S8JH31_RHOOP|nr:hypothetical protein C5613_03265 [Rhodococcus opacus]